MKWTFFTASVTGYVSHPEALFTRALGSALAKRGEMVRLIEPRQNEHYVSTLEQERAPAARVMFDAFPEVQHHTFEMRRGPRLFEWLAREIALIDVAVAVDGIDAELVRWLANLNQPNLLRLFQTYRPDALTHAQREKLELDQFNGCLASGAPDDATLPWQLVRPSIAEPDLAAGRLAFVDEPLRLRLVRPDEALADLDAALRALGSVPTTPQELEAPR